MADPVTQQWVIFGVQFIVWIVVMMRVFARIEKSIDERFKHFELALNTFKVGDIQALQASVRRLENGADEWTKSLRERTHSIGNTLNDLVLRVDRLERPEGYTRRSTTEHQDD